MIVVQNFLPHRAPFLFVDRAVVDDDVTTLSMTHHFSPEEPYFSGHFPGNPIVPGVVLIECMAQAARLLLNVRAGRIVPGYLVGVESAKFNLTVRPGQTILFQARLIKETGYLPLSDMNGRIMSFKCAGYLDEQRCVRGNLNLYQEHRSDTHPPIDSTDGLDGRFSHSSEQGARDGRHDLERRESSALHQAQPAALAAGARGHGVEARGYRRRRASSQ